MDVCHVLVRLTPWNVRIRIDSDVAIELPPHVWTTVDRERLNNAMLCRPLAIVLNID